MIERTSPTKPWMKDYTFILIQSIEELDNVINRAIEKKKCAFDLESTGLDTRVFNGKCNSYVVGYSFCFEPKIGYYVPIRHGIETSKGKNLDPVEVNKRIKRLVEECSLIGHNWLKFDIEIMYASEGIDIRKYGTGEEFPHHDTYILARLAGMQPAGLKWLSKKYLDKEMLEITDIVPSKTEINFASVSPFEGYVYAASDAICTFELFEIPEIHAPIKDQAFIYTLERKLSAVVRRLERNKIKLDKEHCEKLDRDLLQSILDAEEAIFNEVSEKTNGQLKRFQLDSPDEVANVLFNIYDMNPKPEKGKRGNYKTDDETLEKLAPNYPLAKKLQEYRTLTKFHRTYIRNMILNVDKEGYLKFNFSQLKTDSGRFASPGKSEDSVHTDGYSGVNIQAVPARYDKSKPNVRKCISCNKDEVVVAMDWAGVELRVAANMSREPIWLDRFLKGDGDLHTSTAAIIYDKPESDVDKEERQTGKCVAPESLLYVNGQYSRIGNLHACREEDTFYSVEDKNYSVRIDKDSEARIKNFYSNGLAQRYLVCTKRGLLVCSEKHRIELEDGSLVKAIDLIEGQDLKEIEFGLESLTKVNEIRISPFLNGNQEKSVFFGKVNRELSYFLGIFTGDGGCSKNSANIHTGVGGKYDLWAEYISTFLESIGLKTSINKPQTNKNGNKSKKVYFGSRHTLSILQQLQVVNENFKKSLRIPDFILNADINSKLSFLGGLIDTDGCVSKKHGCIDFTTKSWVLAQDMCVLLASCGIHYSVEPTFNKKYKKYYFRVRIAKAGNGKIREYVKCPWKLERISEPKFRYKKYPKNKVICVIPLDKDILVDIEVDHEEHMYLVNNMRTHNTFNFQSVYGGGPGALASTIGITMDDAKEKQQRFFGRLQTLKNFIKSLQNEAEKKSYCVTKFGRKRQLPEFKSEIPKIRANASRKSVNTPIQGTAADLMKLAMVNIDNFIEDNGLRDSVQMLLTMHDELVFRVKKKDIDILPEIEKVMQLDGIIKKINWCVPLKVDVEVGSSWDVEYELKDMLEFLKEVHNESKVSVIYKDDQTYATYLKGLKNWKDEKKKEKAEKSAKVEKVTKTEKSLADFKSAGTKLVEEAAEREQELVAEEEKNEKEHKIAEQSKETVTSEEKSATAEEIDGAFSILKSVNLSDLPDEAYVKLKRSFYEKEVNRILAGKIAEEDGPVEIAITVHGPIDEAKKNCLGYIIDSCPGSGHVKFITTDKEDLHEDWMRVDVLKVAVMCKIFNI